MEANPYYVMNAQHGQRTPARRKQDKYRAKGKKTRREDTKINMLRDAKNAEYKRLHCHEIVLDLAAGPLKASVWNEDFLELRRNIIERYNRVEGDGQEENRQQDDVHGGGWQRGGYDWSQSAAEGNGQEEDGHGEGWQRGGYDWSQSAAAPIPIISDKDEIEALIKSKERFIENCRSIIPPSPDDACFMIPDVQRSIEAREILVEFEIQECCQGTSEHAILLGKVEDYCRAASVFAPSKMLVTIKGSIAHDEMDMDYDDFSPTQARLHTHDDPSVENLKSMNEYYRRREMIHFYKDHGYRILPWKLCVVDGWGGEDVDAYSKILLNPDIDTYGELFM
jgi:hypothetical protein